MKTRFSQGFFTKRTIIILFTGLLMFLGVYQSNAQLGQYEFTGATSCPNLFTAVTAQPANATFSNYTASGVNCWAPSNTSTNYGYTSAGAPDPNKYNGFTITASAGYGLILTSISFKQMFDHPAGANWALRSSLDNFTANIASGTSINTWKTETVSLPASFSYISPVTFRLYSFGGNVNQTFLNDDVAVYGTVVTVPPTPANPTSNSPQCPSPGVTMNFTGTPPIGQTWYWQTTQYGTSTANSAPVNNVTTSGTYYVRARDNGTLAWSTGTGSIAVVVTPNVAIPVFVLGATSKRCIGATTVTYTANATNNSGITYSLDAVSLAGSNTINTATGAVTYDAAWTGTSTITATATGCGGPTTADHTVTTGTPATTPVFVLGATSIRCQGIGQVTYTANASNTSRNNLYIRCHQLILWQHHRCQYRAGNLCI